MIRDALSGDPLAWASLSALVGGVAAVWQSPYLGLALAASSLSALLSVLRAERRPGVAGTPGRLLTSTPWLLGAGVSWGFALLVPAPFAELRGVGLGAGAIGLWIGSAGWAAPAPGAG